jgi:hypothetical protein
MKNQAVVAVNTSFTHRNEVSRANIGTATVAIGAAISEETASYSLSDLQFRIVRYLMPPEFYSSLANTLSSWFNTIQSEDARNS